MIHSIIPAPTQWPHRRIHWMKETQVISDSYLLLGSRKIFRSGHVLWMKCYAPRIAVFLVASATEQRKIAREFLGRLLFPFLIRDTLRAHRGIPAQVLVTGPIFLITELPPKKTKNSEPVTWPRASTVPCRNTYAFVLRKHTHTYVYIIIYIYDI